MELGPGEPFVTGAIGAEPGGPTSFRTLTSHGITSELVPRRDSGPDQLQGTSPDP